MGDDNDENFRWVLERQKEDGAAIKNQARRYIIATSSVLAILIGIWYRETVLFKSRGEVATSLVEEGLFGQLGILSPRYANAFVESMYLTFIIFISIGFGLLAGSILAAYKIEKAPRCQPIGDAEALINKDYERIRGWIQDNDEFLKSYEKYRSLAIELVKFGLTLILFGGILYYMIQVSVVIFLTILLYSVIRFFNELHNTFSLENSLPRKLIGIIVIFYALTRPVLFLQELTNYSLTWQLYVLILPSIVIPLYYVRSDIYGWLGVIFEQLSVIWRAMENLCSD